MRIRKQASYKLFGQAYCSPFPSASSPPRSAARYLFPAQMAVADPGELQCQINLSPWDAIEKPHRTNSQNELQNTNDREEEEKKDGKMRARRMKEMEAEENKRAVTKCKKTDGKGWHCKRDAQLPHTLCGYHLAQLRSYRARVEEKVTGDGERCHRRKQSAAVSNYYYYYSILGPWWGKRRAPVDGNGNAGFNEERNDKTDPGALADNEEDEEEEDDDDEGSCSGGDDVVHHKKKRRYKKKKKRGRKPVKARSLKSLL